MLGWSQAVLGFLHGLETRLDGMIEPATFPWMPRLGWSWMEGMGFALKGFALKGDAAEPMFPNVPSLQRVAEDALAGLASCVLSMEDLGMVVPPELKLSHGEGSQPA